MPHRLLSASARLHLRLLAARTKVRATKALPWNWELVGLPARTGASYRIFYAGTKKQRSRALDLFGFEPSQAVTSVSRAPFKPVMLRTASIVRTLGPEAVLVSEAPMSGTIRVPWWVNTPVRLKRPLEEILATYNDKLRRRLLKQRGEYRVRQVLDEDEIVRINKTMLEDYAEFTHGDAVRFRFHTVRRIALGNSGGRLDLVEKEGEPVACHLGYELKWGGKRYWVSSRFGYPASIFSDHARRSDINSINTFLAMEWALKNGYDYYDMGGAPPHPTNGLLLWKQRRGAGLDLRWNEGFFHVRLPKRGAALFLWDSPLFAAERRKIVLHLGLPAGVSDAEFLQHNREMGYDLGKVYLHCARPPGEHLIESLRRLYAHRDSPTSIEVVLDPRPQQTLGSRAPWSNVG